MAHAATFLFHDFETWGANPRQDYPCQFAAIRTDEQLEPVADPINLMCQIPNDYLPHPMACLVTGITPQQTLKRGMVEAEFASKIAKVMSEPNTCSVGYNSIRFDDEVTRFMLFRNFHDPYEREWKNGNSRWDIIDLARACFALRPDGIEWAFNDDGYPSFKLEALTKANNIEHQGAHDALVDVRATIELAKLIKKNQPKLFDYALSLRSKQNVWPLFNFDKLTPLLHVSSKIPASQGCCTWILPVAVHPTQPNAVICVDLSRDVDVLINETSETIRERLYMSAEALGDPAARPGLKLVHVNKSPFVTTAKALSEQRAIDIGLDRDACLRHYRQIMAQPECLAKCVEVYAHTQEFEPVATEYSLYSGGFFSTEEKQLCRQIRTAIPEDLVSLLPRVNTDRLRELLFLYRGRNYPHTLSHDEMVDWQRHRQQRLTDGTGGLSISGFASELDRLAQQHFNQPDAMGLLNALHDYAQNL